MIVQTRRGEIKSSTLNDTPENTTLYIRPQGNTLHGDTVHKRVFVSPAYNTQSFDINMPGTSGIHLQ